MVSALRNCGSRRYESLRRIITADGPDPDNLLAILACLKTYPTEKVAIVLSPRPVDFSAIPYGSEFKTISDLVGSKTIPLQPITTDSTTDFINHLDETYKKWFYHDDDLTNHDVIEDTKVYMLTFYLRLVTYLDAHDIDRDQYQIYWDMDLALSGTIKPGLHHAAHKPDFIYGFDDELKAEYEKCVDSTAKQCRENSDSITMRSEELRRTTRSCCEGYKRKQEAALRIKSEHQPQDLENLIKEHQTVGTNPELLIVGPFTEAVRLVKNLRIRRVFAMGGFIYGDLNLFPNQFNFMVDMSSARVILDMAKSGDLHLTLLPTECVKSSVYSLTQNEFDKHVGIYSPATAKLFQQWQGLGSPLVLYDPALVIASSNVRLFKLKKVKLDDEGDVLRFQPLSDDSSEPGIEMFWNERQEIVKADGGCTEYAYDRDGQMIMMKPEFLKALERAVKTKPW